MSIHRVVVLITLGVLYASQLFALGVTEVPVIPRKPVLDGKISAEEKAGVSQTSMTLLGTLDRPKHPTDVYMFVNDEGLYVGFDCHDPNPKALVAKIKAENGAVMSDDSVELYLTPAKEATRSNYFHFALNCDNIGYSNDLSNDRPVKNWKHATARTETGWQAEIFIPLESIQATTEMSHWRGNLARNYPGRGSELEEQMAWVNPGTTLHNFKRFGFFKLLNMPFPELAQLNKRAPVRQTTSATVAASAPTTATAAAATTGSVTTKK